MDTVDELTRSSIMSHVRGKDTTPELLVRKALHKRGFRYRLHVKHLPGSPDIVFPKHKAVIFIHGCFWHRHGCHMSTTPKTRHNFWQEKFDSNVARDRAAKRILLLSGWRVLVIWECSLKGKNKLSIETVIEKTTTWLMSKAPEQQIP